MRDWIKKYIILFIALFASQFACAQDLQFNMYRGVTPVSQSIYDLHMTAFWIMVVIGILVFGFMFYSVFKYRKAKGAKASSFHENTKLEIILMTIPVLILIILAIPATKVLYEIDDSSDSAVTIKITGYQWRWKYEYLNQGISYFSDLSTTQNEINGIAPKNKNYLLQVNNPVVIPVNVKVRFLITSNDVIHSWWVPELGVKKDAVPGFIHDAWAYVKTPGIYRGQCAELCGANHGFMPIVIKAVSMPEYQQWLVKQKQLQHKGEQ